ncbi:MAG: NAD(P)/FAD-dependent oxidoreductase [Myxococcota bacterium]
MSTDVDVIVIGSGAGGMAAAVAMARAGRRVLVLEQHTLPGGWCHSFDLEGYSFSPGVHYLGELGPNGKLREVYEGLGVMKELAFEELDPDGYDQIHIGSAPVFKVPKGREAYKARLAERFPHDADGLREVIDILAGVARELKVFDEPYKGLRGLFREAPHVMRHALRPLSKLVEPRVKDPLARAVLYAIGGDHGMPPRRCATILHAGVVGHYLGGAWYPKGGARALPKAFIHELRRHGGQIKVGARVEQLLVEGGRAIGVRLADGTEIRAADVVSNADPHATAALLPDGALPWRWRLRLPRLAYSSSSMSLFMAAEIDPAAHDLTSGNVWLLRGPDVATVQDYAQAADPQGPVPALFLTCTTLKDPTKRRPEGIHTFEAFSFVSWDAFAPWADTPEGDRPAAYEARKESIAEGMLDLIETRIPGFRDRLVFRSTGSPLTNRHYVAGTRGAMYGTEKAWYNMGPLGFGPKTPIPGLWMCGASAMSHGVAGATLSGVEAASAVLHVRKRELLKAEAPEAPRPLPRPEAQRA